MNFPRRALGCAASLALALGALTALAAAPAAAANPIGYVILQGEAECGLASVDLVTGAEVPIGAFDPAKCAYDLEFSPDGTRLLGTHIAAEGESGTASLVQFDTTTGDVTTLSVLGDFGVGGPGPDQGNLTFDTAGNLYTYLVPIPPDLEPAPGATAVDPACDGSAFCLFGVDQTDPTNLTYINHVPQEITVYQGLATSCAGATTSAHEAFDASDTATATSWGGPAPTAFPDEVLASVNLTATGPATTDVGALTDTFISSLDYTTAGTLFGVGFTIDSSTPSLFTIDPTTGAPTEVAGLTNDGEPANINVLGFAIAHPCTAPPAPPTPSPAVVVTPRFTG
jgi:hypothetical protein